MIAEAIIIKLRKLWVEGNTYKVKTNRSRIENEKETTEATQAAEQRRKKEKDNV